MAAARRVKKIHRHLCEARELSDEEIVQAMELYWSGSPTPAYDGKVTAWDREKQTMSMEYSGCRTEDSGLTHDGVVQGGVMSGLIDETLSILAFFLTRLDSVPATIELKTSFLRPCPPGKLRVDGQTVKLGKSTGFFEGSLFDEAGALVARASATLNLRSPSPIKGDFVAALERAKWRT